MYIYIYTYIVYCILYIHYVYVYIYIYIYICIHKYYHTEALPAAREIRKKYYVGTHHRARNSQKNNTVSFHNVNLRFFNLRVSNPNKLIVDVFLTLCRI